jgi:hypothetical protein
MSIFPSNRIVATLATKYAFDDLQLFLESLQYFESQSPPDLYIAVDNYVYEKFVKDKDFQHNYKGALYLIRCLEPYSILDRATMEKTPGKSFRTLWEDFMAEKILLLQKIFLKRTGAHIYLCDSDIFFLGPLPTVPSNVKTALSPHYIRPADANKYGYYNGGFVYTCDPSMPAQWMAACKTSRYYEQAALEDVATYTKTIQPNDFYEFPMQVNYGWWRLFQNSLSSDVLLQQWSLKEGSEEQNSGMYVDQSPLLCIHTHFYEKKDQVTIVFNNIVKNYLQRSKSPHAKKILSILDR